MRQRIFEKAERDGVRKGRFAITLDGTVLSTRLDAARGTPSRTTARDFATVAEALTELERLVHDWLDRDWELVTSVDGTRRRDASVGRTLRAAIAAHLTDEAPYLVYSDWLTEHGDPMGELIAVGIALEQSATAELRARHDALVEANGAALLGIVSSVHGASLKWRRGFVDRVSLAPPIDHAADEVLAALFRAPAGALLRDLVVAALRAPTYHAVLRTLATVSVPPTVRRLALVPTDATTSLLGVREALRSTPNLEVLVLHGSDLSLGSPLPRLRRLELVTSRPSASLVSALASYSALDTMALALDGRGDLAGMERMLATIGPALRSLDLRGMPLLAPIIDALLDSGLGMQLEELGLPDGDLSGADARKLLALGHLKRLDLTEQPLAVDIVDELRATFGDRVLIDPGIEGPLPPRRLVPDDPDDLDDT